MKSLTTLAVAGLVAGCSAGPGSPGPDTATSPPDPPTAPYETPAVRAPTHGLAPVQSVDASLAKLRALQIFAVYGDIEKRNCYAGPCIEDPAKAFEPNAAAAARVADFTSRAIEAAAHPASDCYVDLEGQAAQDDLAYLRSLEVAVIGDLIVAQPKNNPNCYNLPCAEDKATAAETNRGRARSLASIAAAFRTGR